MAPSETTVVGSTSAVVEFKVDYKQAKQLAAVGNLVESEAISTGRQTWRIYFTCTTQIRNGKALEMFAVFLRPNPMSMPSCFRGAKTMFHALLDAKTGMINAAWSKPLSRMCCASWKLDRAGGTDVVSKQWAKDGQLKFLCSIVVNYIPAPPSDICEHLGTLLDTTDGTDVSFTIDGEVFQAHRAMLAARSPVFRAELLGSMSEAKMTSINLLDIAPATFKAMLRYMYTDALPRGWGLFSRETGD
ncbi:hypothetical protein BS78_07G195800 [Paspalum vaginatum]|nr:hypothetical protein BS78_07G195800 [Paspalum vaginatum]